MESLKPAEISFIDSLLESWSSLTHTERKSAFLQLSRTAAEELFLNLKANGQAELLEEVPLLEKRSWMRLLAPDDAADLIQELPLDERENALGLLDHQTRREVAALLHYAEDAAGGLMNSRFARLRPDIDVDEAIKYLRAQAKSQVETIYYAYVIDSDQKLLGVVSFRDLFSAASDKKVRDIMQPDIVRIPDDMDQEEVSKLFSKHDLICIPVVDKDGHIKGIVTSDDILNVVQEEATEDIQKLGGLEALEDPYLKTSFWRMVQKRAGWLSVLFVGEMFTASAMGYYEKELEKAVVLALFIPMIISSGGNSGSQASSLMIRALSLGEVRGRDWFRVFRREVASGVVLGGLLGLIGFFRVFFWPNREKLYGAHFVHIGYAVAFSLIGVVLWGTIAGSMLPFLLRRVGFDPASASAPLVATLVDVTGLVIYFSVASLLLSGAVM
ncbi:MAG: magnesium transporter [Bdellovibrionales bacterium]|nr:magnesium transporter [Bdellovibrionales bacterium]